MRIANNISALKALNILSSNNSALQKTIRALSSGLRINSAADDASGLAISEKMRSQIGGLDRALHNTQDGISLLQTADGALNQTASMLQRMRELSVQAANDTLTQQDRNYIQVELDQIKDEINRTAKTTQFNKKKILNGEAGAIWSSSDLGVKAYIHGAVGSTDQFGQYVSAEGNYDLEIRVEETGSAQVQKTNIIDIQEIETSYAYPEILINEGTDTSGRTSGKGWVFEERKLSITKDGTYFISGTLDSNNKTIATPNSIVVASGVKATIVLRDVNISTGREALYATGADVDLWIDPGEYNNENILSAGEGEEGIIATHTAAVQTGSSGKLRISSMAGDYSTEGKLKLKGSEHGAGIGGSCSSGDPGGGEITIYGGTIEAEGGYYASGIGGGSSGGATPGQAGNITIYGGNITAKGGCNAAGIGSGGGVDYTASNIMTSTGTITIAGGTVTAIGGPQGNWPGDGRGAGIGGGSAVTGGTIKISPTANVTVEGYTDSGQTESIGYGEFAGGSGNTTVTYENIARPAARDVPEHPDPFRSTNFRDFQIEEIQQFYTDDGSFLLEAPQTLTITQGDGKSSSVTIYANDTMYDVAAKINDAIASGLGQAKFTDNARHFCTIADGTRDSEAVSTQDFDEGAVKGTMLVRSVIPGKKGEISFAGNEELLNVLGLNTITESREAAYTTTVRDSHSGEILVNKHKSTGSKIHGLIHPNVDVELDYMYAATASWDENDKKYRLLSTGPTTTTLHLADNSLKLQVGANEGERFIIDLGDMSAEALGVSTVNAATHDTASRAITVIDNALDIVNTQRAKIGASTNTLEHTMSSLTIASENLTQSESRIRDADIAKMMLTFTKYQIMTQSGVSMLSQANQFPQQVLSLIR